jgi:hypothetical protein
MQISTTTVENSIEIPQKTRDRTAIDPVIPLLDIYPKERKTGYSRDSCKLLFIAGPFTITKLWKQPRCPTPDE